MRLASLAFLAGILCLQQFHRLPSVHWLWLIIPVVFSGWRYRRFRVLMLFMAGMLWMLLHAHVRMAASLPPDMEGRDLLVQGRIVSIPEQRGRQVRFLFSIERLYRNGRYVSFPLKVRLNWYGKPPVLVAGSLWQLQVRLKRPNGFMNSAGFDYERWLFQQGIRATGYVRRSHGNRQIQKASGIGSVRQAIAAKIHKLNEGSDYSGILTALAVGYRGEINNDQWQVMRRTGTTHLMAISGLHVGMVATLFYWLGSLAWRRSYRLTQYCATPRAAAVIALLAAFVYAALAGFSVPTQRALVMIAVVMVAIWSMRPVLSSYGLATALFLVLLVDPFAVMSIGFWLSFMAVGIIFYALGNRRDPGSRWSQAVRLQWVVSLGLVPLTLFLFSQASLVSPLANLAAVPWVSLLVVPLVLMSVLLMPVSETLALLPLWLADTSFAALWPLLDTMSAWGWASWERAGMDAWMMLAAMSGIFALFAPAGFPSKRVGLVMIFPLLFIFQQPVPEGGLRLAVLDVGQGLAIAVHTRNRVLVYDTGPRFSPVFDTGQAVLVPYLQANGIGKLDMLVISHADNDHRGGLESLLAHYPGARLVTGVPERVRNAANCHRLPAWSWDGVRFSFLDSNAGSFRKGNNRSCVLKITARGGTVLIPGDIERRAELELIKNSTDLAADILVVPHHGSMTSSSVEFLQAVMPNWAVVSAGYRNRFRHPRAEIHSRYQAAGITWLNTRDSGMLVFSIDSGRGVQLVRQYRREAGKYWHRR